MSYSKESKNANYPNELENKNTLPSGEYVLADPAYVLSEEDYEEVTYQAHDEGRLGKIIQFNGFDLIIMNAPYGDGAFHTSNGGIVCVDSGMIAAIPFDMCLTDNSLLGAVLFDAEEEFECVEIDDVLHFGDIKVQRDEF